jgi:hypothetical protein
MRGLLVLSLSACGWVAATRVEVDVRHKDLLQEMEALRSEVERLRERVRVLEYEKAGRQNGTVATNGLEAWGFSTNLRRSLGERATGVAAALAASQASTTNTSKNEGDPSWEESISGAPSWGVSGAEGGSDKFTKWRAEKGGGWVSLICAILFIGVFGSAPLVHSYALGTEAFTKVRIVECVFLYTWLSTGIIVFTQIIEFQSPHFSEVRTLSIEEAVYLVSQIVTTVGYGDITPAYPSGQVFVGFFVFLAIMLAGQMISELTQLYDQRIGVLLRRASLSMEVLTESVSVKLAAYNYRGDAQAEAGKTNAVVQRHRHAVWTAAIPMMHSAIAFLFFAIVGATFFVMFPGENKTPHQAVYMSLITLSTVGFGAFTPNTHGGMVFAAFWMLFGVASLASLVSSRAALALALRRYEAEVDDMSEKMGHSASEDSSEESCVEQKAQDAGGTLPPDSEVMTRPHCGKSSEVLKQDERESP